MFVGNRKQIDTKMHPKELTVEEKKIFEAIDKNDVILMKTLLVDKNDVNLLDENLMSPLQHAAYKGNKEMVQILLDQGADPNLCEHEHSYTALHFGGLSGNVDICNLLLIAGAKSNAVNSVGRTAAQMAAFVGNHACVTSINNFVPKKDVEYYTVVQGQQEKSYLNPALNDNFHKFITSVNIHPIKVALNLHDTPGLIENLEDIKTVLDLMCKKEMQGREANEVMSLKFHYLGYIVDALHKIQKSKNDDDKKKDILEVFTRKLLKPNKDGNLEVIDTFIKECIREFPFRECTIFRQLVSSLAGKDSPPALGVLVAAINGQRGFVDSIPICHTCGEENPAKKCSKCKIVKYCNRNCQRLDWFVHKKSCNRLGQGSHDIEVEKPSSAEISNDMQNLLVN